MRKMFTDQDAAKKKALFVAQRIQSGMQHVTDLKPHERDSFKAAETLLENPGFHFTPPLKITSAPALWRGVNRCR